MPITTNNDIIWARDVITSDPYIKSLGFTPERIMGYKNSGNELSVNNREINLYNVDGDKTRSSITMSVNYEVDIMVSRDYYNIANEAKDQIIALLQSSAEKHKKRFKLIHPGLILSVPPTFYGIGFRFSLYETIFNSIKKVEV